MALTQEQIEIRIKIIEELEQEKDDIIYSVSQEIEFL